MTTLPKLTEKVPEDWPLVDTGELNRNVIWLRENPHPASDSTILAFRDSMQRYSALIAAQQARIEELEKALTNIANHASDLSPF